MRRTTVHTIATRNRPTISGPKKNVWPTSSPRIINSQLSKLSQGLSGASWWSQDGLAVSGSDVLSRDELGIIQDIGDVRRHA